jgi:NhaP-type Na+/H+ or K+/H+ antiporter
MWFGPKGFASVVYALLVLESGIPAADQIFHLAAITIVASILAHSSTDIVVARWFDDEYDVPAWFGSARDKARRMVRRPTAAETAEARPADENPS